MNTAITNEMVTGTGTGITMSALGDQSGTLPTENLALHWRAGTRKLRMLVSSSALGAALILTAWRNSLVVRVMRLYVKYLVQASDHAKCPACGIRAKHKMHYENIYAALIHTCARCTAQWGEPAVVNPAQWNVAAMLSEPEAKERS